MSEERFEENINEEIVEIEEEIIESEEIIDEIPVIDEKAEELREKKKARSKKIALVVACAVLFGGISGGMFALSNSIVTKFANARFKIESTQDVLTKGVYPVEFSI